MQKKMGFLGFLFGDEKFHNQVVENISQRCNNFLSELKMNGKVLFVKKEPEAFERRGKRVDLVCVVKGKDFRRDHFVTVYRIILVEVKMGRWQERKGIKQLRECRDFLVRNENWKTWLGEKVAKLEGREVWMHLLLMRVKQKSSWKDMVCDLSRHNLPGKTRLGRYSSSVKVTIAEGARGVEEVRRIILDGEEEE